MRRERRAERTGGDAVVAVDAIERADQLVLHGTAADWHVAEREQPGGDREQRLEQGRAVVARRGRPPAAPGRRLDEIPSVAQITAGELVLFLASPLVVVSMLSCSDRTRCDS